MFLPQGAIVVMLNRNADRSTAAIANLKHEFGSEADVTFVRMDLGLLFERREESSDRIVVVGSNAY